MKNETKVINVQFNIVSPLVRADFIYNMSANILLTVKLSDL
jgi:hypothetical protein